MKTIYLLPFSILTAMSLVAQNVEPTHKHVSYGPHKDMNLNFWKIEAKKPTLLLKGNSFGRKYAHAEQHEVNMIQNERFKLVTYKDGEILYDLKKDPEELTNAIARRPEIAGMLREKRDHWLAHSGEVKPSVLRPEKGKPRRKNRDTPAKK